MDITNFQLLNFLDSVLTPEKINDFCPNGLQVEGKTSITKIVTGVTASQALIDQAVDVGADAIIVHHGYFWKGESPCLTGMKKKRISTLLEHDINLYAYHLPLDIHPELGNNAQLAKRLGIIDLVPLEEGNSQSVVMKGRFPHPITPEQLNQKIHLSLNKMPLHEPADKNEINTIAWCTGGGQGYIEQAANQKIDAFITGEVSEQTIHIAREMNIHFYACGHHATERYGAKALGEHIQNYLGIESIFIDVHNPA
ncbi:Nif3-like dinuclear metal center hexameric protein [Paraglaciecola marina]|uniref:Nif3-like dinuclear metal center hexameric protein n=1 Tax=Paraglaciecola marina TaxID=2500157 RepID=UPI0010604AF2|nr:Nif3-like dinuclear metal center hexameric protein [Paraglaciecola marina]